MNGISVVIGALVLFAIASVHWKAGCSAEERRITGGTFRMGYGAGDKDEQPVRNVTVAPFSLDVYEVTEEKYAGCVAAGACTPAHYSDSTCRVWNGKTFVKVRVPAALRNPHYPVVCVTWQQARQYCRFKKRNLPTEIEWEYAARSGVSDMRIKPQCIAGRRDGPQPVGSCGANRWGLHDMTGNVWEWVTDWYDAEAYQYDAAANPSGPDAGIYRVIRGGGWYSRKNRVSVSNRQWFSPGYSEVSIGFRCANR